MLETDHIELAAAKFRPFCSGFNVLTPQVAMYLRLTSVWSATRLEDYGEEW